MLGYPLLRNSSQMIECKAKFNESCTNMTHVARQDTGKSTDVFKSGRLRPGVHKGVIPLMINIHMSFLHQTFRNCSTE